MCTYIWDKQCYKKDNPHCYKYTNNTGYPHCRPEINYNCYIGSKNIIRNAVLSSMYNEHGLFNTVSEIN